MSHKIFDFMSVGSYMDSQYQSDQEDTHTITIDKTRIPTAELMNVLKMLLGRY